MTFIIPALHNLPIHYSIDVAKISIVTTSDDRPMAKVVTATCGFVRSDWALMVLLSGVRKDPFRCMLDEGMLRVPRDYFVS